MVSVGMMYGIVWEGPRIALGQPEMLAWDGDAAAAAAAGDSPTTGTKLPGTQMLVGLTHVKELRHQLSHT